MHTKIIPIPIIPDAIKIKRYRREKDGKLPYERLAPPRPPTQPIPQDKSEIPAYRAEAIAIFEASLPSCGLNTKFPVNIRLLHPPLTCSLSTHLIKHSIPERIHVRLEPLLPLYHTFSLSLHI
jgi:hypothetical protein